LGFVAMTAMIAATAPAYADTAQGYPPCTNKPVSTIESDDAHTKYIAGRQDYDEGNYENAVRRFRSAYTLDCTKHELLLILSSAYERKGDKKEALSALETYVARVPSSPDMATYQLKIDNLKKDLARQSAAAPAENRGHTPYPWILVGIGGAAVAAGLAVVLTAPSLPGNCFEATSECTAKPGESAADVANDGSHAKRSVDQPRAGWAVFGGGLALVAGGLLWHFLEPTGPKKSGALRTVTPTVTPSVSPGFAGLSLGGAF
jgi:hypothetical protein